MRRADYMRPAITAGALLLLSLALFRSYLPYVADRLVLREPPAIVLAMEDAYLVGLRGKTKVFTLKAEKIEIGRDRTITTLTGITRGKLFDRGKVALRVRAGRAVYDERREKLDMSRGIRIQSSRGESFSSEGAHWDARAAVFRGTGRVVFRNKWAKAEADDLTVDVRNKDVTLRNVSFTVRLNKLREGEASEYAR